METRKPEPFKRNYNPVTWLLRHFQMSLSALGRLVRNPLSSLMTAAVIGIAVALPAALHLGVDNFRSLSNAWEGSASISLFLNHDVTDDQAAQIQRQVATRPDVAEAELVTRAQALEEFRRLSGFGEALDLLDENPLPPLVLVRPAASHAGPAEAALLAGELQRFREIDLAQVDLQWVQRLQAITHTVERGIFILAGLLGAAIVLIVGNTIRLEIQNRHAEIEITKLVGGTDAFIRRPFLYEGLWYGLFGAAIASALVILALGLLQNPVERLAGLYQSDFDLSMLTTGTFGLMLLGTPLLGLGGAWLAVSRQLAMIQPE